VYDSLIHVSLFQSEKRELKQAESLYDILVKRPAELVPLFYRALVETGQEHVASIIGYEGLHALFLFVCFKKNKPLLSSSVIKASSKLGDKVPKSVGCGEMVFSS